MMMYLICVSSTASEIGVADRGESRATTLVAEDAGLKMSKENYCLSVRVPLRLRILHHRLLRPHAHLVVVGCRSKPESRNMGSPFACRNRMAEGDRKAANDVRIQDSLVLIVG
jgi:hypothetical protein